MKRFRVRGLGVSKRAIINADYVKVENGHLVFRVTGSSYPEPVLILALGHWTAVWLMKEKKHVK